MENAARDVRADILGHEVSRENMAEFADELSIEYAESSERRADIQDVLEQLDPRHAEVLTLHYYDGMRLTEIAKMLHEPTTTVRSRLAAAKKAALALFREKGIDKTLYGGSVAAILTCALRNAVGSSILSAVVAQDMLDHILNGRRKDSREATALYRLLEEKRNRAIRRLASLLIVPTVSVVLAAVLLVTMIGRTARRPSAVCAGRHRLGCFLSGVLSVGRVRWIRCPTGSGIVFAVSAGNACSRQSFRRGYIGSVRRGGLFRPGAFVLHGELFCGDQCRGENSWRRRQELYQCAGYTAPTKGRH